MVQQDVLPRDGLEQIVVAHFERRRHRGRERRVLEVRAVDLRQYLAQAIEIHRPVHVIEVLLVELELLQQELDHRRRDLLDHLEPDRVAEVPLQQLALQRDAQVLDFFLVDEELGVPRHPELVGPLDRHAGEQLVHVGMQDRSQVDEGVFAVPDRGRQPDRARQDARRLHDRDARAAAECIAALQLDDEVEALVEDARERMRRVEPERRQDRQHLALEIVVHPGALRVVPGAPPQEADAGSRELRQQRVVQQVELLRDELPRLARHDRERLLGRHALGSRLRDAELDLLLDARDADLEELVEIRGDDREEPQPLEQRHGCIRSLREHAPVEREDAELAVERRHADRGFSGHWAQEDRVPKLHSDDNDSLRAGQAGVTVPGE